MVHGRSQLLMQLTPRRRMPRRAAVLSGKASATTAVLALSLAAPAIAVSDKPIPVVATFSILGDMVKRIGGERVSVTTLVGPDGDAHVYQPTPADARAVSEARPGMITTARPMLKQRRTTMMTRRMPRQTTTTMTMGLSTRTPGRASAMP